MIGLFANLRFFRDVQTIPDVVRRWDELGLDGVVLGDHLFPPTADPRTPRPHRGMDQLTMLTVIATLSPRLQVGAVAANVGFQHPLFLVRKFAQLAELYGGERVYAGFGAGWAEREFEAIGLALPSHPERIARLEESLRLARSLYDDGYVDIDGAYVQADALPLAPMPEVPPRILVGGGSKSLIGLAGRYADHLDLNAPSHRRSPVEPQRKLMTTIADLEGSVGRLEAAAAAAGRPPGAVSVSVVVTDVCFCSAAEVETETARICAGVGLEPRSLADSPFALIGEPGQMAAKIEELRERLGLSWIGIPFQDVERFCADVAPLLA